MTELGPKPKSMIDGKTNPEYSAWYRAKNPEKAREAVRKSYAKKKNTTKKKTANVKAYSNNCARSIVAMNKRGRSHTTIAVVLKVPISTIIKVLEQQQNTKP